MSRMGSSMAGKEIISPTRMAVCASVRFEGLYPCVPGVFGEEQRSWVVQQCALW